jgi:hypothetical protein
MAEIKAGCLRFSRARQSAAVGVDGGEQSMHSSLADELLDGRVLPLGGLNVLQKILELLFPLFV